MGRFTGRYDIGPGWRLLVEPLVQLCEGNGGTVDQIKEKFGGLRFSYTEPEEQNDVEREFWESFAKLVEAVESMSLRTCEFTGAAGTQYISQPKTGWIKTVSPFYAEENDYHPIPRRITTP